RLPKGTRIEMVGVFDNSADNPQNPNHPPQDIHFGWASTDEMFGAELFLAPLSAEAAQAYRPSLKALDDLRLPPGGFPIPPKAKFIRENYDKN
ncbi:hypothetical protein, partial [Klebsiella pneumoniae]|uniref:hypothetical protein n=1 Tax=Klebsiella pneumoniae TaxID=573 RepID=UPI003F5212B6